MDKKTKKTLIIVGAIEVAILLFCLIVSIIVIVTWSPDLANPIAKNGPFIGWFQKNTTPFFLIIVLPVFVIFLVDAVYLVVYSAKKPSALTESEREAIQAQAREEARKELEAEMKAANETKDEKK